MSEWATINGGDRERTYYRGGGVRVVGYVYWTDPRPEILAARWALTVEATSTRVAVRRSSGSYATLERAENACDRAFQRFATALWEREREMP